MGEKKQIRIAVKDKIACLVDEEQFLVCGNNDYEVVFDFDSDWEGISAKTAVFVYGNTPIHKPFVGNVCEGVEIKNATLCAIGVFAGNIKTTTGATIECRQSIRDIGGVPKPPSKEVYDEIMELLDKAISSGGGGSVDLTEIEEKIESLDTAVKKNTEDISKKVSKSEFNSGILETKEYAETLVNPIANKQNALEERVTDLESLTLTYIEDGSTAYEKSVPAEVGKYALIKGIGGATERVFGKNLINPTDISWSDHSGEDKFSYIINADGTITYTTNSQGLYVLPDISNLATGRYYIYVEGALNWKYYGGTNLEINCTSDFDESLNDGEGDYVETTRTLKVMLWRDESVTTDTLEIVEAPEGTVFEPFIVGLIGTKTERVESIGADGTTVIDTFEIPEEARELIKDGIDSIYCNRFEFVDDKVNLINQCPKIVLNGSEAWSENSKAGVNKYFYMIQPEAYVASVCVCDYYEQQPLSTSNTLVGVNIATVSGRPSIIVRPENADNMSVADFKAQLAEKPITLVVALATPKVTDKTNLFTTTEIKLLIERGGVLRFVNKDKMPVPSSVWFTTRKE
jgi:hypothetical protein